MRGEGIFFEIENVTKRFGNVAAVDGISLSLKEKEFFALLGPSGCGKTTLLRVVAGFEAPDEGRVLLDGNDLGLIKANHRPINLMFQSYALFPHLSVHDNVAYGLKMEGVRGAELKRQVADALEMVQLSEVASRRPYTLSGGQLQRVALARALIKRPRLLLLDEPLAALDKKLREQMQFELKKLQHEVGIAFIVVTHDQQEALAMADRIAVLNDGKVEQLGSAQELYERPNSHFVANFIGTMNFFEGKAVAGGVEVAGLGTLRGVSGDGEAAGTATAAVRPERIRLHGAEPEATDGNVIAGRVEGFTYLGNVVSVFIRVESQEKPLTVLVDNLEAHTLALEPGAAVWCAWPVESTRVLVR
ncbi:MAG: ABC transporter ATP-binding protein [Candidatus Glassbacteria bacterium]|nr:ABC transporter ATP-binding protein [Candidatus Glassbacteria bacterium]